MTFFDILGIIYSDLVKRVEGCRLKKMENELGSMSNGQTRVSSVERHARYIYY